MLPSDLWQAQEKGMAGQDTGNREKSEHNTQFCNGDTS
jgi:hypothetical protein